jgi:hypothetical protein
MKRPTACVTRAGAGVDSVWEQEKPEAGKMLENAARAKRSPRRAVHAVLLECNRKGRGGVS